MNRIKGIVRNIKLGAKDQTCSSYISDFFLQKELGRNVFGKRKDERRLAMRGRPESYLVQSAARKLKKRAVKR